jgi:hypothetical protein
MRASCLTFGRRHSLRERRPRELKPEPGPRGLLESLGCVAKRPPQPKVSALLSDAQRHRRRCASLHPAPRRSQRRLTPFFSSLLGSFARTDTDLWCLIQKSGFEMPFGTGGRCFVL